MENRPYHRGYKKMAHWMLRTFGRRSAAELASVEHVRLGRIGAADEHSARAGGDRLTKRGADDRRSE